MEFFKTSDLPLATTLVSKGHQIVDIDARNPRRIEMVFEDTVGLRTVLDGFQRREVMVEPRQLLINHRIIKQRLYDVKRLQT